MIPANSVRNHRQIARHASNAAVARLTKRRAPLARTLSRLVLVALLAAVALSLASSASAQIPAQTVIAGSFPNAVAVNPVTNKIYIANSSSNNVTVVDGATNTFTTISDSHATSPVGIAVNSLTNMVYVANNGSDNVSVFSGAIGAPGAVGSTAAAYVTTITNGNGLGPSAIAVDAHLNQVYVANSSSGNITIINGATNAILATRASGTSPSAIAVNSATGFFYVVNEGAPNQTVAIFNGNTNVIAGAASMPSGSNPFAIAVNEATDQIYVSNSGTNTVIQIDGGTQAITGSPISNGNAINLQGIAVNPVTNQVFVAAGGGNTLVITGPGNSTALVNDPNATGGTAVTVDSITNTVYVANFNGTATEFNGSNPTPTVFNFATGGNTEAIAVNPVTHRAYAACNLQTGAFTVLDGAALIPTTISSTDSAPVAIGVNPVTNLIYVANSGDNDVTVINGATNTVQGSTIGVGNDPVAIAVDPTRNQIYVVNNGENFITDIDGASTNTAPITDSSASGLTSITFDPVTNTGFFIGATSQTLTSFTTIFGVSTGVGDQSLTGFAPHPGPVAINPSNGQIYILDNADFTYTVLDAVTGNSVTNGTGSAGGAVAVAINPVTNFAYIAGPNGILVVNGADLSSNVVSDSNATGPSAIAVNPVTNLVYVANSTSSNVSVFQGATSSLPASYITTVFDSFGTNPQAIAVNPATDKIYVVNSGSHTITVIDGVSNGELDIPVGNNPVAAAVNSISNQGYIVNRSDDSVTAITEYQPQTNNLQTTISTFSGNAASTTTPTFTFSATNTLSEATPPPSPTFAPIANIYYQVDTLQGTWTPTKTQSGFSATLAPLTPGLHIIYAFATDGEDSTSTISGLQSGPTVGQISSYEFLVASEIGQFFSLFGPTLNFNNQGEGIPSAPQAVTLENEGGAPMTFTFALGGNNAADFITESPAGTLCNQLGGTLPANSQCQFFYSFQPSTLGAESATLTVNDTSTGTPVALPPFTLTGTGEPNLAVTVVGSGTVADNQSNLTCVGPANCNAVYAPSTVVVLTATPSAGFSFSGWSGPCSGTGTCTVTMSANQSVTATFTNGGPTLSIGESGTGLGTVSSNPAGIACQPNCSSTFSMGQQVTLTATPASGSLFAGWTGGGCSGTGTCIVTMNSNQTVTAMFTLTAASACPPTVTSTWIGGSSNWNSAGNWRPSGVPGSGAIVCIANGVTGDTVQVDISPTLGGLYIDAGNTLNITDNQTLTVSGTVFNAGTIKLSVINGDNVVFRFSSGVTLTGGGTVTLSKGSSGAPILNNVNNGSLINVNNTIQGAGQIGNNGLSFTNQAAGVVNANDASNNILLINAANVVNQGLIEATGNGVLQTSVTILNQDANIKAIGSAATVDFISGADIQGGTLTNSTSLLQSHAGNSVELDGSSHGQVTIVGTYTMQDNSTTDITGTLNNTGTIVLAVINGDNVVMRVDGAVTLTGGGTVTMSKGSSGAPVLLNINNGSLTNVNNLIQGAGQIGNNGLVFTNQAAGIVNANDAGGNILLINANGVVNQGLFEATDNGYLQTNVTILNQNANIKAIGGAATVDFLSSTVIQGGTLTNSGGLFQSHAGNNPELDGSSHGPLTLVGTYTMPDNSTTDITGTFNNTGTVFISVINGDNVAVRFDGPVILTGGGTVTMSKGSTGTPVLLNINNGSLTNVNNLIQGAGQIGNNGLVFTNQAAGIVNANDLGGNILLLNASNVLNQGLIEATGNGVLQTNVTINNQGANIQATGGNSVIQLLSGADIQGGTIANNGGLLETIAGNGVTLDGSTRGQLNLIGTYMMQDNSTTDIIGTLNNTGSIIVNVINGDNVVMRFDGPVILTGGGTVTMSKGSTGTPVLLNINNGSLTNVNNLIQGAGQIGNNGLLLTNQALGVINANDLHANGLLINASGAVNQGLIEATNNGVLQIDVAINNQGANIVATGANSAIQLSSSAIIRGGTLSNNGGLVESIPGNSITLDGATDGPLTLAGTYTMQDNSTTDILGTLINTGTIIVNVINGDNVDMRLNGAVTLTGGGSVNMSKGSTGTPILLNINNGSLTNVNNTIHGSGQIGNNGLVVTNGPGGTINADSAGNTLLINPGGTFLNQGLVESTTGTLQFSTTVDNAGTIFPAGNPPTSINQSGGFTQEATGALQVIVGGTPGNNFSSFYGTNNGASLNGALNIVYASGFTPVLGETFRVFGADALGGTQFASINSPALPPGLGWSVAYTDTATLTVVSVTSGSQTLTISDLGSGNGTVTDDLGLISCTDTAGVISGTCSASYAMNTTVNLTATLGDSTTFGGWGNDCTGTGACSVFMGAAQTVTASFVPTPTMITLNFTASPTPQTQTAVFDCPSNTTPCTDPNAHSLALTVAAVSAPFSVTVQATEIPAAQADGVCETGNNITNDFDCRFVSFFPGPQTDGGQREPLCDPYAAGNCVHYNIFSGSLGQEPPTTSYTGPVNWQIDWNNGTFAPPPTLYQPTPRLFDDPDYGVSETTPYGTSCTSAMLVGITNPQPTQPNIFCQFEFDITTSFNPGQGADPGIGGTTRQFNDVVVAYPLSVATPNLTVTKTADANTISVGAQAGFTVSVANSTAGGTGTANNVQLNDPLPGGAGANWSINPAYTGLGTCSITGAVQQQNLVCSFGNIVPAIGASVHVISGTTSSGTLSNTATITADNNSTITSSASIQVGTAEFTPVFSGLTPSQTIEAGTTSMTLYGVISAGSNFPPTTEFVSITIDGITVSTPITSGGNFSTTFNPSSIPASATPYTITYNYAGDTNYNSATDSSTSLTVTGSTSSTLSVTLLGSGVGSVSDNDDISCSETGGVVTGSCSGTFGTNSQITLTASATQPSTFIGWGGACANSGTTPTCLVTVSGAVNVTANFAQGVQSVTVSFNPGTNVTNTATFNCPTGDNPCTDPNAHALQLMVPTVLSPFEVTMTATEVPPNQANGDCSPGNTVLNDFDCRFSTFFTFGTAGDGGMDVPLCDPYANGNCIFYSVFYCVPQATGPCVPTRGQEPPPANYSGGVGWLITWNNGAFTPPSLYTNPPRLYDDPDYAATPTSAVGTNCSQFMTIGGVPQTYSCQFEFDITTQFFPGDGVDPGIGGTTRQFNDVVVAYPPANVPQLQATSAPDNSTVTPGNPIGFTISVVNNGSAPATNVTVNDPLPSGTGVNWSISPAVTGCSISGTAPNQILGCTFTSVAVGQTITIHVISPTAASGTYTNAATILINGQQLLTIATLTVSAPATTTFTNLTPSQSITFGAASINLSGTISAGTQFPPATESISITINGAMISTPILANGNFTATFPTSTIPGSTTPYPITYSYAGDINFAPATNSSTTLTVNKENQTISLTGAPTSAAFGSTFPISVSATSHLTVTVVATGGCSISGSTVTMTSGTTTCTLTANQAGNSSYNPAPQVVVTVTATKANSTTTITSTPNPSTVGQTVTVNFKVTGTGGTPTGSVTVTAKLSSTTVTCTGTLTAGAGSCTVNLGTAGTWTITSVYSGDNNFNTSNSNSLSQVVNSATSTLQFSPTTLNFGTLYPGEIQFEFLTLTNTGSQMITFSNFSIASVSGADSNGFFGVSFCPHTLNAGKSCTIIMGFLADSVVNKPHAATLVVTDNAPLSPQTVPMTATVINPIARLSTYNLSFGNQNVHTTSAPKGVTLSNIGTTPLIINSISISGNFAFVSGTSCANGQSLAANGGSCTMLVTFTPTSKGSQSGSIRINDNAPNSPQQISLSGTGK